MRAAAIVRTWRWAGRRAGVAGLGQPGQLGAAPGANAERLCPRKARSPWILVNPGTFRGFAQTAGGGGRGHGVTGARCVIPSPCLGVWGAQRRCTGSNVPFRYEPSGGDLLPRHPGTLHGDSLRTRAALARTASPHHRLCGLAPGCASREQWTRVVPLTGFPVVSPQSS